MYDLNEKKFVAKKSNEKSSTKNVENQRNEQKIIKNLFVDEIFTKKNDEQKINEKLFVNKFSTQQNVIKLIRMTYFNNIILQKIIKIKKLKRRRVFVNITQAKMKLKFEKCEIRNEFF